MAGNSISISSAKTFQAEASFYGGGINGIANWANSMMQLVQRIDEIENPEKYGGGSAGGSSGLNSSNSFVATNPGQFSVNAPEITEKDKAVDELNKQDASMQNRYVKAKESEPTGFDKKKDALEGTLEKRAGQFESYTKELQDKKEKGIPLTKAQEDYLKAGESYQAAISKFQTKLGAPGQTKASAPKAATKTEGAKAETAKDQVSARTNQRILRDHPGVTGIATG